MPEVWHSTTTGDRSGQTPIITSAEMHPARHMGRRTDGDDIVSATMMTKEPIIIAEGTTRSQSILVAVQIEIIDGGTATLRLFGSSYEDGPSISVELSDDERELLIRELSVR